MALGKGRQKSRDYTGLIVTATDVCSNRERRAYDYAMTRRQVLEAICCVVPMTGMVSATLGLRAMRRADEENND